MADYPLNPLLTNVAWQKNKGAYAKMAGTTGLGTALTAMNSAYRAVDWEFIDVMPILKKDEVMGWGKAKVLERQRFAKKNCAKAGVFEKSLQAVIDKAKATDTQFKASKLPNIATGKKAVADILKAANDMKSEFNKHPWKLTYNQWDGFVRDFGAQLK
jgi:hypothetical protein